MYYPIIDRLKRIAELLPTAIGGEFIPSGTKQISITQNGTTTEDVTQYASAEITVNVPIGGSYDGIEIVDYYDTGEIKEVNWHGDACPRGMCYFWYNTKPVIVNVIDATTIAPNFFSNAYVNPTMSYLEKVTRIAGYGFTFLASATNDLSGVTLSLPNFETPSEGFSSIDNRFRNNSVYYYGGYYFPKNQRIAKYDFYQHKVPNATWQIGSVGYPVLQVDSQPFGGSSGSGTITIYTTGNLLDTIKNAVQNGAGANYTWIYKAAETTTYNGTTYAAGDTMLTV